MDPTTNGAIGPIAGRFRRRLLEAGMTVGWVALCVPLAIPRLMEQPWPTTVGAACCGGVLTGAVAFRRVRPRIAFPAASVAMLGLVLLPSATAEPVVLTPLSVLYLVTLYSIVAETDHHLGPLIVCAIGLGLVLIRAAVEYGNPLDWGAYWAIIPVIALSVGMSWALGAYRRAWRKAVEAFADRARQAERLRAHEVREGVARERERISHEVHDVVAHSLAAVVVQADAALMVLDRDPDAAREMLKNTQRSGREAMEEISAALSVLRKGDDRAAAVRSIRGVNRLVEDLRADGLNVELQTVGTEIALPPETARAAYRIVQESLTNALKHVGREVRTTVRIEYRPEHMRVSIRDDGSGFGTSGSGGLGLIGMEERARQVGGTLDIGSGPTGTTVTAKLPTP